MDLLSRLIAFRQTYPRVEASLPWVVGVSGGPDSLSLLHLLHRIINEGHVSIPARLSTPLLVAHLDHAIRPDSRSDADFVDGLANDWTLPVQIGHEDVPLLAREKSLSIEEAARQARYAFLARTAVQYGAGAVFVGHNADDQSETVLMHLLRGTGLAGLRGMQPVGDFSDLGIAEPELTAGLLLVRPLLATTRAEIESYCREQALKPRHDPSNEDPIYFRNRLRNEVLPYLEDISPRLSERLRRTAAVATADYEVLTTVRDEAWETVVAQHDPLERIVFDRAAFRKLLPGLQRAILRHAVSTLRPTQRNIDFTTIVQAADLVDRNESGTKASLPGNVEMLVAPAQIILSLPGVAAQPLNDAPAIDSNEILVLPETGSIQLPECNWQVEIDPAVELAPLHRVKISDAWQAYLDADKITSVLMLRTRQPSDRFQPLGMSGHNQKVSDFMINAHIPATWRDRLPLLVCNNEIVWIPGWRLDHRFRIRAETSRVVQVHFRAPDEQER